MTVDELKQMKALRENVKGVNGVLAAMQAVDSESLTALIDEKEKERATMGKQLSTMTDTLTWAIQADVTDPTLQEILIRRYVAGESLKSIAEAICYSCRYVYALHEKALKTVASVASGR